MIARKCNTCGGIYRHHQDGALYLHACPPDYDRTVPDNPVAKARAGARNENLTPGDPPHGVRAEAAGFVIGQLAADGTFTAVVGTHQATAHPGKESE